MANLPPHFKENDVDQLLAKFGQVVSTRILRDTHGQSKGVGFARMESREKCEQIIQVSENSYLLSVTDQNKSLKDLFQWNNQNYAEIKS